MKRAELNAYIVADPEICHGKPTFKNTRVMVWQILEMLKTGETARGIHKAYPSITKKHIQAALDYEAILKGTRGTRRLPVFLNLTARSSEN